MHSHDTIYAISTGLGKSAVAIIRVSGPESFQILKSICPGTAFRDREAILTALRDGDRNPLDRGLVIRFSAPRSYTGEDMVELQVTGSRAVLSGLLRALSAAPHTRPAEPGEFARRAFENGKLDLIEVEGLVALIEAETIAQLNQAMGMSSGRLSKRCEGIRGTVLSAIAQVEAMLDFSDVEDASGLSLDEVFDLVAKARGELAELLQHSRAAERLRDGLVVVIAGEPNVGKSTLLNCLAKREVAIVSPFPGTTRDSLEVFTEVDGFPVTFVDTAGIRETADPIESQGVARSLARGAGADLVLWLFDSADSYWAPEEIVAKPTWKIRSKVDRDKENMRAGDKIAISAQTGSGIDSLLAMIGEFAKEQVGVGERLSLGTERQRLAVVDALTGLDEIDPRAHAPIEIVAESLRFAAHALGRITGQVGVEEVLGEIFSRLCVGK